MYKMLLKLFFVYTLYFSVLHSEEFQTLLLEGTIEETFGIDFSAANTTIQVGADPKLEVETLIGDVGMFGNITNSTMTLTVSSKNGLAGAPNSPILKTTPGADIGIQYDIIYKGVRSKTAMVSLLTGRPGVYPPSPLKIVCIPYNAEKIPPGSYQDVLILQLSVR